MTDINPFVKEVLQKALDGSLVLPDFQRPFIWEPEKVRELVVSVLGNYHIGSILILEGSIDKPLFRYRLIEGVERVNKDAKVQSQHKIVLDGQQRLTSLFYALYEPGIPLKGKKHPYKVFIDLDKALLKDWDSAVQIVRINDKKRLAQLKSSSHTIPARLLANLAEVVKMFKEDPHCDEIINIANNFMNYPMYWITLPSNTELEKIVETFERVNRTGEPLHVFDLVAARLYKDNIKLRDLWADAKKKYKFANDVHAESVLRVVTLVRGKGTKRKALLEMESENFEIDWHMACSAMEKAYVRITNPKTGYGAFIFSKWMPYSTMIVPLAAIIEYIFTSKNVSKETWDKINHWYWVSVFAGRYDEGAGTKQEGDCKDLKDWIKDTSKKPEYISSFKPMTINLTEDKQNSAIYRGVINLCVLKGALDFANGQGPDLFANNVEDDHIFPDSIFHESAIWNRTLLSSNEAKSKKKPSDYFKVKKDALGESELKRILETHLIPGDSLKYLLEDDLKSFMGARKKQIRKEIESRISS